ncbi:TPA: DUF3156 family protein [Pseudomonas aeruginosa]|uniref:DUF3156 family protein n=1 Tax=Pseudomonas aeruginosa TaxID=287 RepID=UPI000450925D|nr:DUF3156 family protein [Pseudomonas aeruginosa]ETV56747.1 hypothetical protein Q043_00694 [Pseudomonas aeruginosa BWHPSA038]HCF5957619.1 DUF3156 family protein [Pseudomonas aeruginosa]HCF5960953.1 DUF3156 family protein [Pseudomonas aeruginosa]HCF5984455.1 DUF3156 family protein [Pseudomonas aeruginosa]HCF5987665.1 DUF3156 family protein [Pseudomonas aeruginosa]
MSAWARWYERHWRDWRPAAYRPGATLALVRRNLAACDGEAQDGRLLLRTKELSLEVRERVQAHLFMHIVSTEFSLFVAAPGGPPASLELRHAGCLRRRGILCKVRSGSGLEPLREVLQGGDRALLEQLMPLDFRSLRLCRDDRGWTVSLEHLGACEVVNRFPAYRRYIPLVAEQRLALLGAFAQLQRLLSPA